MKRNVLLIVSPPMIFEESLLNNIIEISVGSLIYSTSRVFKVTYAYEVPESEIPA